MKNIIKLISLLVLAMASINPASAHPKKAILITIYHVELNGSEDLVWRNKEGEIDTTPQTPPKRIIGESVCFPQKQSGALSFTSKEKFDTYLSTLSSFEESIAGISYTQMTPDGFIIKPIEFKDLIRFALGDIPHELSFVITKPNQAFVKAVFNKQLS